MATSLPLLDLVMIFVGARPALRLPRLLRMPRWLWHGGAYNSGAGAGVHVSTHEHARRILQLVGAVMFAAHLVACAYGAFAVRASGMRCCRKKESIVAPAP